MSFDPAPACRTDGAFARWECRAEKPGAASAPRPALAMDYTNRILRPHGDSASRDSAPEVFVRRISEEYRKIPDVRKHSGPIVASLRRNSCRETTTKAFVENLRDPCRTAGAQEKGSRSHAATALEDVDGKYADEFCRRYETTEDIPDSAGNDAVDASGRPCAAGVGRTRTASTSQDPDSDTEAGGFSEATTRSSDSNDLTDREVIEPDDCRRRPGEKDGALRLVTRGTSEATRIQKRVVRNLLANISRLPACVQEKFLEELNYRIPGKVLLDHGIECISADFLKNGKSGAALLVNSNIGVGELMELSRRTIEENRGQVEDDGDWKEVASASIFSIKRRFFEKARDEIVSRIASNSGADRNPEKHVIVEEVELALSDAVFGRGNLLRDCLKRYAVPLDPIREAVGAAVDDLGIGKRLCTCEKPVVRCDETKSAVSRGGCAEVRGAFVNMTRHGFVKGVSSGLAYVVKQAIVVLFIELLGLSRLDFFWRSLMGNLASMLYYGFGYDELRKLISDNLNACFVGLTFKENREQDLYWRTWGEFVTDGLPRITFTPAAEGLMGLTGVSAQDELALYVVSKIAGKSMADFGAGFVQAALRRTMPETYRQNLRDRRELNVLRTSQLNLQGLNSRFSHTRRFRATPEVCMKLFVYPISYVITAVIWATLYPMQEEAAGYHSEAEERFLQKLAFNVISTSLALLMLFAGRLLWKRYGPQEPSSSAGGDVEDQFEIRNTESADRLSRSAGDGFSGEAPTASEFDEYARDDLDRWIDGPEFMRQIPLVFSALMSARFAEDGDDLALDDPESRALSKAFRLLSGDEGGRSSDDEPETGSSDSMDEDWLSDDGLELGAEESSDDPPAYGEDDETTRASDANDASDDDHWPDCRRQAGDQ